MTAMPGDCSGGVQPASALERRDAPSIPPGWTAVALGDLVSTKSGNSKLIKGKLSRNPSEGLVPAYSASGQDVWAAVAEWHGDGVVLSAVGARCGKTFLARGSWTAIANTHVLMPTAGTDPRWLWYLTNDESFWIKGGTAQPFVKMGASKSIPVLLPPIEEQRRIAAVLDAAEALRAKRREVLAKLDTLMQAIFFNMFGSGAGEEALIGDLGEVQGGLQVSAKRKGHPIQVPYLRVANVHRGRLDLSVVKTLQVTERELSRVCLEEGDLLVVEGHGNTAEIGRVGMWDGSIDPCVHQNHLIRVRCNRRRLLPRYAEAFLNSRDGRRALLRAANTTSGLNTISTSDVRSVAVFVPALSDQQRFVEAANRVDQHRSVLMRSAAEIDTLLASLQQRAFRGEL